MSNYEMNADIGRVEGNKTIKSFVIGFVLSLILATAAFGLVQAHAVSTELLYVVVGVLGILQMIVQIIFFLRLSTYTGEGRWSLIALIFTIIVVMIIVSGSLWIMYNLNYYMVH